MIFTMFNAKIGSSITGQGKDVVGQFQVSGNMNQNGDAIFTKMYPGQYAVSYTGKLSGDTLAGNWTLMGTTDTYSITK